MKNAGRIRLRKGFMIGLAGGAAVLALGTAMPAGASTGTPGTSGKGKTVSITINVPALVVDNLCNTDVVNLSGDMTITTTTTPAPNGAYTVQTSSLAKNLKGSRIAPPPAIGYRGTDGEDSYSYVAPPPYPSTHEDVHYTKLVPQGKAPTMYLVVVFLDTTTADGTTVPVLERSYLACTPPSRGHK
jgi:hypothetical protein